MIRRSLLSLLVLSSVTLLSSCGATETETQVSPAERIEAYVTIPDVSGAKAAVYIARTLSKPIGYHNTMRPSAMVGVFVSNFIAQGTLRTFASALTGIEAQMRLLAGQQQVTTNEVFTLMSQYSTLLQVNVPDMLNRSTDRDEALDTYVANLQNYTNLLEQKDAEMEATEDELTDKRRDDRDAVQEVEREINRAFRNEEFEAAASKQEELAELEAILTKTEIQLEQIDDMRDRFEELLKIGNRRLEAIEANRRIILSGLKVVDVPGIEDFELILDE